ncbi:TadE/TadG family type IV pilus assembly protein [Carnobacterium divergens]|uniref:Pilus assembly protein n=1 Tax=Carnobacterium divergens TaxID=2748 RepID=A0AAW8R8N2_CARDV|nr:TadE family protein [Carnobacterium divergens]MDT1957322.1 pilus assembly protein [Carnobacterium divergens]MDT1973292.1 pilus assembly protein [Carnobacterium divergens]
MKKWWRKEEGSLILETAIILPFFLMFVFLLWTLIRISVIQMALDKSTSELVQSVNSSAYGISIVVDKGNDLKEQVKNKAKGGLDQWLQKSPDEAAKMLNITSINNIVVDSLSAQYDELVNIDQIGASYYSTVVGVNGSLSKAKLKSAFKSNVLTKTSGEISGYYGDGNVKIEKVDPVQATGHNQLYKVHVSYKVPLNLPFIEKEIKLQSSAGGYLWTTNK